ncbi:post-GPI attachment to proteins factor 3 [Hyposmocoma kahamanoa]|uniref:post-GPI attachment to proteins factor 3 n=1 Tax=Hyposmocoma kahamanoa TaxID=1477025 RepID=UPI000E6D6CF4|nr:post-GPI attachment to proteins factor 3 [Hyposmocoma kahamanoa]
MQKLTSICILVLYILIQNLSCVLSSAGDRSPFYQRCVNNCVNQNCTSDGKFTAEATDNQDAWCKLLQWSCKDECRYACMWNTVAAFQERGLQIPMFHGKWPFKRFLGIQEPASAFFSLLNLVSHTYMFLKIYFDERFSVKETPMLKFWFIFFVICAHAWLWSIIFHSRDTPITEFMDYACALSMVLSLLMAAIVRILYSTKVICILLIFMMLTYFADHVRYLYEGMLYGRIDYEYNMTVNVISGATGAIVWLVWALWSERRGRTYAWRVAAFTVLSGLALLLELADFAPLLHALDAHALWHLATVPLPSLFYRLVNNFAYRNIITSSPLIGDRQAPGF